MSARKKTKPVPATKPVPVMRKFTVIVTCRVELELSDAVITVAMSEDWQRHFLKMSRPEDVAAFVGANMARSDWPWPLSDIDGFADRADDEARITDSEWDTEAEENK